MSRSRVWPAARELDRWIDAARNGSTSALGQVLETCRDYLLLIANQELGRDLQGKVAPSDLVQATFIEAQVHFEEFRGQTESEMIAWLRRILLHQVLGARRHYSGTAKRDISRELSWNADSSLQEAVESLPCDELGSGRLAADKEDAAALYDAIESLPSDYRHVVLLRYWEELTFEQIGQRMGRSAGAARKLWLRAVERLELGASGERDG